MNREAMPFILFGVSKIVLMRKGNDFFKGFIYATR